MSRIRHTKVRVVRDNPYTVADAPPVPTSTPFLPTLPILVDELNRTRDLYNFIKQVWEAFDELTRQQ